MTPEELDQLQEELDEHLPTSLQVKLGRLIEEYQKMNAPQETPSVPIDGTLPEGIVIRSAKRNSHGTIIFEGFCTNSTAEQFINDLWIRNKGVSGLIKTPINNYYKSFDNFLQSYHTKTAIKPHKNYKKTMEEPHKNEELEL